MTDDDLLATDHIKKAYVGQTSNLMYRPGYRWYYLSGQTKEECFIFKMWDSLDAVKARCKQPDPPLPAPLTPMTLARLPPRRLPAQRHPYRLSAAREPGGSCSRLHIPGSYILDMAR